MITTEALARRLAEANGDDYDQIPPDGMVAANMDGIMTQDNYNRLADAALDGINGELVALREGLQPLADMRQEAEERLASHDIPVDEQDDLAFDFLFYTNSVDLTLGDLRRADAVLRGDNHA
jgi:hypothetical protein